jgi:peroxiredoxin
MALKVGDVAPDFTLKDNHGKEAHLGDFRGMKVVLGFHPLAWTRVCAEQMQDLEASGDRLDKAGAIAFGLSVDSTFCKKAWAESLHISKTRLLSDFWPHGRVAEEYGIFNDQAGTSKRATVVLDAEGKVRWMKVYPNPERPNIDEIVEAVENL